MSVGILTNSATTDLFIGGRISKLMGRWPDDKRSTLTTVLLVFVLFPLLCWMTVWFVRG